MQKNHMQACQGLVTRLRHDQIKRGMRRATAPSCRADRRGGLGLHATQQLPSVVASHFSSGSRLFFFNYRPSSEGIPRLPENAHLPIGSINSGHKACTTYDEYYRERKGIETDVRAGNTNAPQRQRQFAQARAVSTKFPISGSLREECINESRFYAARWRAIRPSRQPAHRRLYIRKRLCCRFLTKPSTLRSTPWRVASCTRRYLTGCTWAMPSAVPVCATKTGRDKFQTGVSTHDRAPNLQRRLHVDIEAAVIPGGPE